MAIDIQFEINDGAIKALANIEKSMTGRAFARAVRAAVKPLQAEMRRLAPVRSGALKKAIVIKNLRPLKTAGGLNYAAMAGVDYRKTVGKRAGNEEVWRRGLFQEIGTKRHGPQPFIAPVSSKAEALLVDEMTALIDAEISKASA